MLQSWKEIPLGECQKKHVVALLFGYSKRVNAGFSELEPRARPRYIGPLVAIGLIDLNTVIRPEKRSLEDDLARVLA